MRAESRIALTGAVALLGTSLLGACHHAPRALSACHDSASYQEARSDPPLKYPPGYQIATNANVLKLPRLDTPEPPARTEAQGCLDDPPQFVIPKAPPPPQA